MSVRRIEPEWLDVLPAGDPRAERSRRELARVNALMANAGILARALHAAFGGAPASLAEIGAGDGRFALRLARAMGTPPAGATITLVDRQSTVDAEAARSLEELGWRVHAVQDDVFSWLETAGDCDAMVANLFLHHFQPGELTRMLHLASKRVQAFAACEPRRSALAAAGSHLLGLVGCGEVTRHDAVASVRAGFDAREISALWPGDGGWVLAEGPRGLFSHLFSARRK